MMLLWVQVSLSISGGQHKILDLYQLRTNQRDCNKKWISAAYCWGLGF